MKVPLPQPCPIWANKLAAAHAADLSPAERAALEDHLASCPACSAQAVSYARMDAVIVRLPAPALPGMPAKLLALWAEEDRRAGRVSSSPALHIMEQPMRTDTPYLSTPSAPPERPQRRRPRRLISIVGALAAVLVVAVLTTALVFSRLHTNVAPTGHPSPEPTTAPTVGQQPTTQPTTEPTATGTPGGYTVLVYFSKHPDSDNNPNAVFSVKRTSPDLGVATFALTQLFLGPTANEQTQGYYSEFVGNFGPINTCADTSKDFTLSLDHRATRAETGTATVTLCHQVLIPGDLAGFRMTAMITQTLTQFPNIKKVVILNYQGDCFNDLRGDNACISG